ncbi:MAG: 1-(5-phosphoribosyl)-5-[(5-phosphoribosylamino)methylideneamino] imidazole-4-carboxamide isomerase [Ignavibacteriales bacterium]|nr:MAG: 1-(5-phosphoribosyl)-5-[(5-phosphoribosylamino)methylideneamino] imidazole-4-carboxamide isomerase [Ignavibacteriales bacterium]
MKNKFLLVIPSIDIRGGKTVRVVQGIPELNCTEYGNDPVEMARIWRAENAKMLHVVDFDAAIDNSKQNFDVVGEICSSVIIPVEFAGGIRTFDDAKMIIDKGIARLVVSTMAIENRNEFVNLFEFYGPSKIVVALDVIDGELVTRGRKTKTGINCYSFATEMKSIGVERFIVTDVVKNGMMEGPNLALTKKVADITGVRITHSGGIRNKDELSDVQTLISSGVDSVIIGRALYENRFPCQKLWRVAELGIFN